MKKPQLWKAEPQLKVEKTVNEKKYQTNRHIDRQWDEEWIWTFWYSKEQTDRHELQKEAAWKKATANARMQFSSSSLGCDPL